MSAEPYYQADRVALYLGDCIEVMRTLPEASVDAVVCDPPYNLGFMGKAFDTVGTPREFQQWCETWAREAYRVLKPGGWLAAFGGTRTHHRLASGIEDAGFDIRDMAAWMYGSGFPKSHDVSKAIDRAAGAEREVIGPRPWTNSKMEAGQGISGLRQAGGHHGEYEGDRVQTSITAPATAEAAQWQGWGTALKPAHEPICLARKPLIGTVAQNVLAHGTGALNIDGCRIESPDADLSRRQINFDAMGYHGASGTDGVATYKDGGRWPANVVLDEEAAALLDATVGGLPGGTPRTDVHGATGSGVTFIAGRGHAGFGDQGGGPSRFFKVVAPIEGEAEQLRIAYTAKASRSEREAGLEALPARLRTDGREAGGVGGKNPRLRVSERHNDHPTVKPVSLMRWLCRLVTPPGGVILDPFLGSGTTALAALDEQFRIIGIDMDEHYLEVAKYRLTHRHLLDETMREPVEELPQGRLF